MIAIKQADNTWVRHRSHPYFADAKFISDEQIIASGGSRGENGEIDGLIAYSPDEGRTWSNIYFNPLAGAIGRLFVVDSRHIWAIGYNGLVVRLEARPQAVATRESM